MSSKLTEKKIENQLENLKMSHWASAEKIQGCIFSGSLFGKS